MRLNKLEKRNRAPLSATERDRRIASAQRRTRIRFTVVLLTLAGLAVAFTYWKNTWIVTQGRVLSVSSELGSPLKARLASINVAIGDRVAAGDLIATLDDAALRAELARAEQARDNAAAALAAAREAGMAPRFDGDIKAAEGGLKVAERQLASARGDADSLEAAARQAASALARVERLFLVRAATRQELERAQLRDADAQAALGRARGRIGERQAALEVARERLAQSVTERDRQRLLHGNELARLEREVERAARSVEIAEARLADATLLAPRDGIVTTLAREPGEVVDHDDVVAVIAEDGGYWVEAYVNGDDLPDVAVDRAVSVRFPGLDQGEYRGRVAAGLVGPASADARSPVGPDRVRNAQQLGRLIYPVRIELEDTALPPLRPEMIARVSLRR